MKHLLKEENRRTFFVAAALFSVAFIPRLFLLLEYRTSPYFDSFLLDPRVYQQWAQEILKGDWMGGEVFYHAPLYPYLMAFFFKIFREDLFRFFLFQAILSSLTAVMLYRVGREFFGSRAGSLAALLFSFTDLFAFYTLKLLPATLAVFLLVWFVLAFKRAERSGRPLQWFVCGLSAGFVSLTRSNLLLLYPLLVAYFLLVGGSHGRRLKKLLAFSLGFFLLVGLCCARNYLVGGDPVLVAANGGETFYHGNNVNAEGTYAYPPEISPSLTFQGEDAERVAERESGRELTRSEISRFWFGKGLEFILEEPWRYVILEIKKLRLLLSGLDTSIIYYIDFEKSEFLPGLKWFFVDYAVILPLAMIGLWISRREWKENFILYGIILVQATALLAFFVTTRYRLPMVPFLLLYAGYALSRLEARFFKQPLFYCLAFFLSVSLLINGRERERHKPNASAIYCNLGYTLLDRFKFMRAIEMFGRAKALNNKNLMPYLGVISTFAQSGRRKKAMKFYKDIFPMMRPRLVRETLRDPALAPIHDMIAEFLKEKGVDVDY